MDGESVAVLHVTVKHVQQFAVYFVEILADNDSRLFRFHGNDVDDLEETVVPHAFRFASQEGHVDFVVDVADAIGVGVFLRLHRDALVVFEPTGRVGFQES